MRGGVPDMSIRGSGRWLAGIAMLSVAVTAARSEPPPFAWQVESSITTESGRYGTDETTSLFYWPLTVRRNLDGGDVSLTVPWMDLNSPGGQSVVDGSVVSGTGAGGSGMGDAVLKGRYNWIDQTDALPYVDLFARLKLPLADEDKGLGTGETDLGFGIDLTRRFQEHNLWFAGLAYTFMGDPPGIGYDNRLDLEAGLGRDLSDALLVCGFYNYRSSVSSGSDDAHSVSVLGSYRVNGTVRVFGMLEMGLSDGAPDQSLTLGGSIRFH